MINARRVSVEEYEAAVAAIPPTERWMAGLMPQPNIVVMEGENRVILVPPFAEEPEGVTVDRVVGDED